MCIRDSIVLLAFTLHLLSVKEFGAGLRRLTPLSLGWILLPMAAIIAHYRSHSRRDDHLVWFHFLTVPIITFVFKVSAPGEVRDLMDLYHYGETTASAHLIAQGAFPFRDLIFIHGLFEDPIKSLIAFKWWGPTFWSVLTAERVLWVPLMTSVWTTMLVYLFRKRWAFALGLWVVLLAPFTPLQYIYHGRLLVVPSFALFFYVLLQKYSWKRGALFCLTGIASFVLVPESVYLLLPFALSIFLGDALAWGETEWKWQEIPSSFRRTWQCAGFAAIGFVLWTAYLMAAGGLGAWHGFIDYFKIFGSEHALKGGLPEHALLYHDGRLMFYTSIVAAWCVVGFIWFARKRRWSPDERFWMAWACAAILYFQKYLSRADIPHLIHSYALVFPVLVFFADRILARLPALIPSRAWRRRAGAIAAGSFLLFPVLGWDEGRLFPNPLREQMASFVVRVSQEVHPQKVWPSIGYSNLSDRRLPTMEVQREFLRQVELSQPGFKMLDFTNAPLLYFFFLDQRLSTRFFHIPMAMGEYAQAQLIEDMKKDPPVLIPYYAPTPLMGWDGVPNSLRHYDASEYILRNYEPWGRWGGATFLIRKGVTLAKPAHPPEDQAPMQFESCDMGYSPIFFRRKLSPEKWKALPLALGTTADRQLAEFSALHIDLEPAPGPGQGELWFVSDSEAGLALPETRITFKTRDGQAAHLELPVGACIQWHRLQGKQLVVRSASGRVPKSIQLLTRSW